MIYFYLLIIFFICRATGVLLNWQNFRRLYLYALTEAIKALILKHRSKLLADDVKEQYSLIEKDIISAATLPELDDAYTRYNLFTRKLVFVFKIYSQVLNYSITLV